MQRALAEVDVKEMDVTITKLVIERRKGRDRRKAINSYVDPKFERRKNNRRTGKKERY